MIVNRESRYYSGEAHVWVGKYKNLSNLPHWHSDCEIVCCEQGHATVYLDREVYDLSEGESIFIAPSGAHSIKGDRDSILAFFIFDSRLVAPIIGNRKLCSPLLAGDYRLAELFSLIDNELRDGSRLALLSANNRIERLTLDIFLQEPGKEDTHKENFMEERYKKLLKNIDENFAEYTLSDAARFVALNESYFSKFFKQMASMTFSQYLNLVRVEKAIEMIRKNELSMTEIAVACGFGTIRNFNRVFKAITGFSPRALPVTYSTISMHPTYGIDDAFDPTSADSELIISNDLFSAKRNRSSE